MLTLQSLLPSAIGCTFELMQVAEEEIEAVLCKIPASERPEISFAALAPTQGMSSMDPQVYRSHARELIQRQLRGEKLDLGTLAECLVVVSNSSLIAPLDSVGGAVAEKLFTLVMGKTLEGEPLREPWPHAVDEQIMALRRRLSRKRN